MKKLALGCLVAAVLVMVSGTGLFWYTFLRKLPTLDAKLSLPNSATLGKPITMVIIATNPQDHALTLDSIDIDDAFLSGFQVVSIDPEPSETMHVPILDQRSWWFSRSVPPGGETVVTFELMPVQVGHFSGDVDVCNPSQDWTTLLADVVINEKPADEQPVDEATDEHEN